MQPINRRDFLLSFSSAFAAVAIKPSQAVAVNQDLYLNQALGIAIKKPSKWVFQDLRNFADLKSNQILSESISPELESEIMNSEAPLVVFAEASNEGERFKPSAALYAEHLELLNHETIDDVIKYEENLYSEILPDYRLIKATPGVSVNGYKSIKMETMFTFKTDKISPISVRNISIITQRHPFIYTLRLFDSPANSMNAQYEMSKIVRSIHYS